MVAIEKKIPQNSTNQLNIKTLQVKFLENLRLWKKQQIEIMDVLCGNVCANVVKYIMSEVVY